jgi:hypothetical protein
MSEIAKAVETLIVEYRKIPYLHDFYVKDALAKKCLSEEESKQASEQEKQRIEDEADSIYEQWTKHADSIADELRGAASIADERGIPSDAIWEAISKVHSGEISDRALGQLERLRFNSEPKWIRIKSVSDLEPDKSTIGRHAADESKPWIRRTDDGYEIREDRIDDYLKSSKRKEYRLD